MGKTKYKEIAERLCEYISDSPLGCEICPLYDEDRTDEGGNFECELWNEVE